MNPEERIRQLLAALESPVAQVRWLAARALVDWIDGGWPLDVALLRGVAEGLLDKGMAEQNKQAKEGMFLALAAAAQSGKLQLMNWARLSDALDSLPASCLEYALIRLGCSGEPEFRPVIRRFAEHPVDDVRETVELYAGRLTKMEEKE